MITIDFETRSRANLKKVGASKYAQDESTSILCLAYRFHKDPVQLWIPELGSPPNELLDYIDRGALVEAHNAGFERAIWYWICHKQLGWPDVPFDQWRCSMAQCARTALPRSLDEVAEVLNLPVKKDMEGSKIMQRLTKPKKPSKADPSEWDDTPAKFEKLFDYCKQDVVVESAVSEKVPALTPIELKLWQLDQRINLRGLRVDRMALESAIAVVAECQAMGKANLRAITEGKVDSPSCVQALLNWVNERIAKPLPNLAADTIESALTTELPNEARQVLEIRRDAAATSTSKLAAMLQRCDPDGRVRGSLVYHGAATGRWSGAGIQIHNFPRGELDSTEIDIVHQLLPMRSTEALELLFGNPLNVIKSCLRSMIVAEPGKRLLVCDFASIEARVLAWLAHEEELLIQFKEGADLYKAMASKVYTVDAADVNKVQRQVGKVAILGLGYGMGWKSFIGSCKQMAKVSIDAKTAKHVVKVYRDNNPNIKSLWHSLNTACIRAIETRQPHRVGRLEVTCNGAVLRIKLPSGRFLHYHQPKVIQVRAPWSVGFRGNIYAPAELRPKLELLGVDLGRHEQGRFEDCDIPADAAIAIKKAGFTILGEAKEPEFIKQITYWGVDSQRRKWTKIRTYGASLVENVVQAIARDFLASAMLRVERAGYPIVATVHDEILCELEHGQGSLEEFESLMREIPDWGKGCPIDVEGFESERYRK